MQQHFSVILLGLSLAAAAVDFWWQEACVEEVYRATTCKTYPVDDTCAPWNSYNGCLRGSRTTSVLYKYSMCFLIKSLQSCKCQLGRAV